MENNYLTIENFDVLINSPYPNKKAKIISDALLKKYSIHNKFLYEYNENKIYVKLESDDIKLQILKIASLFIEKSFENLSEADKVGIMSKYKNYSAIFSNNHIDKYFPQLKADLKKDMTFDIYYDEIHFLNGFYNLKTLKFEPRTESHYVTKCINRDYEPSKAEDRNHIMEHLTKIYPEAENLKIILSILGASLTGRSTKDHELLVLMGMASAGKSTLMSLTLNALSDIYVQQLKSDTFEKQNPTIDKTLNQFLNNPQTRLIWINEMTDKRIDESLVKQVVEGELKTNSLYKDGMNSFRHFAKIILTSNNMPNFRFDDALERRIKAYLHKSKFIKQNDINPNNPSKIINEKKHQYLADSNLLDHLSRENYLNAFIDMLASFSKEYLNGERPKWTGAFLSASEDIMNSNNWCKDFVDAHLIITGAETDRIGKNCMLQKLKSVYPEKHLTWLQLKGELENNHITWDAKRRCDRVQGCYVGVKFRVVDHFSDTSKLDDNTDEGYIVKLIDEINELKKLLEAKDKEIEELKKTKLDATDEVNLPAIKQKTSKAKAKSKPNNKFIVDFSDDQDLYSLF